LAKDVHRRPDIKLHLRRSAETIARRLRRKSYVALGVGIKLKTWDFQIVIRQQRLGEPTDVAERLYCVGVSLLKHVDHPGPFRLIGMVAYDLNGTGDVSQLELFGTLSRQRRLEVAVDNLIERFGTDIVRRANDLGNVTSATLAHTLDFLDDRTSE
jgi:DNA polymerase-4